ncbi:MAG: glutaredoxin 3 [Hyphomonadaceae bacterium]|nr:glutaredoxin 3 [Hyphomonadaceae bacterium]GIK48133.1 MAG: glutaredoxin 3 [Alphaproteobacteria bacterium]
MKPVTVYTRAFCPYCTRALALLERKGVPFTEIDASDPERRQEMIQRSGRWTFPQIFIGDTHVGGCDDLHALDQRGALDPMLAGT